MKSGSKIHSAQVTATDAFDDDTTINAANRTRPLRRGQQRGDATGDRGRETGLPRPMLARGNIIQGLAAAPGGLPSSYIDPDYDEEIEVEIPGLRVHAPWPGLHGLCGACGAPSVSGLGSGPTECEHCHLQIAGGVKVAAKSKGSEPGSRVGKELVVAVTSSREIALGKERAKALEYSAATMLVASLVLLTLLLVTWRGLNVSHFTTLSPWVAVYLPIPLGLLDGAWSLHCAKCGHILHHDSGHCASRGGLCGTAWGCSGPSCALNLGLDLGLLITAALAALPAGASAKGCGYDCFVIMCFPCAPGGGVGMAAAMVIAALLLATAAGFKMWMMAPALLTGHTRGIGFRPW